MRINRLSVRPVYEQEASDFIIIMIDTIKKYAWAMVFDMDETFVMINKGSNKTIVLAGSKKKNIIPRDKNEKEYFTCIGSCFSFKKYY